MNLVNPELYMGSLIIIQFVATYALYLLGVYALILLIKALKIYIRNNS